MSIQMIKTLTWSKEINGAVADILIKWKCQ